MERVTRAESSRPVYLRLAEALARQVGREGAESLPSARSLAVETGLNRATVTAAYRELARRGLVVLRPGRRRRDRMPTAVPAVQPEDGAVAGGLDLARYVPDPELLPGVGVFRWLGVGGADGESAAQYGNAWGYRPLREWLAARFNGWGVATNSDRIVLTAGVQHGLDLLLRCHARAGDTVLVEDPTYPGLPPLLGVHQLRAVGVPLHRDGLRTDEVAAAIKRSRPRVAVLTPTLQNPSGLVMPMSQRREVLRLLLAAGVLVIEELFDPGLVGEGRPVAPLAALDPRVVAVGSFSKALFPGLRVGWITGPSEILDQTVALKRATDLSGSTFLEVAAFSLCRRGTLDAQLTRLRRAAMVRRDIAIGELGRAPAGAVWTTPRGGFSLLLFLPHGVSARAVAARTAAEGVWTLPGPAMSVSARDDVLRVAYAAVGGKALRAGVAKVVGAIAPPMGALPLV